MEVTSKFLDNRKKKMNSLRNKHIQIGNILVFLLLIINNLSCQCNFLFEPTKKTLLERFNNLADYEGFWTKTTKLSVFKNGVLINEASSKKDVTLIKGEPMYTECGFFDPNKQTNDKEPSMSIELLQLSEQEFDAKIEWPDVKFTDHTKVHADDYSHIKYSYLFDGKLLKLLLGNNYSDGLTIKADYSLEKFFPKSKKIEDYMESSGTGFALSRHGFVITNYHVVKDARVIRVRGVKGDMSKSYDASLFESDEEKDIALLKINADDIDFGPIPYSINTKESDVGRDIFVLGYPLLSTMGAEIKLTNGIISSQSGFLGDKNLYQISAPVQPGNSGAPVFDKSGNLIGVISSQHKNAQNVSYAIKSDNLTIALATLSALNEDVAKGKELGGLSLPNQVKKIRNYIYIIEVY